MCAGAVGRKLVDWNPANQASGQTRPTVSINAQTATQLVKVCTSPPPPSTDPSTGARPCSLATIAEANESKIDGLRAHAGLCKLEMARRALKNNARDEPRGADPSGDEVRRPLQGLEGVLEILRERVGMAFEATIATSEGVEALEPGLSRQGVEGVLKVAPPCRLPFHPHHVTMWRASFPLRPPRLLHVSSTALRVRITRSSRLRRCCLRSSTPQTSAGSR